jgi:large subunit ribosomal protein L20
MRTTNSPARKKATKALMNSVKGYTGQRRTSKRKAIGAQKRAEMSAFVGRKQKKRDMRRLWITRLNIAARQNGISYSHLIAGLHKADIRLDRKQLSEMAINEPSAFAAVIAQVKAAAAA